MGKTLRARIFKTLKSENYQSALSIAANIDEPDDVVKPALYSLIDEGYLGIEDSLYYLKHVLDPIPPQETAGVVEYSDILAEFEKVSIPGTFINSDIDYVVHRDQGNVGSCVGQATAYGRDLDLIRMVGQYPDDDDFERVDRDVYYNPRLWYDVYFRQSMSAEYAYRKSREVGHVLYPSGSYLSASMKSLKENGICLHDQWLAPKSGIEAWREPYPDFSSTVCEHAEETAKKHKIVGYAAVRSFEEVKEAIFKHGYILGTIAVWENYGSQPNEAQLPDPSGAKCGAHALCFVGYSADRLYFLHSWCGHNRDGSPSWKKVGWISKNYFDQGFCGGYVVLDDKEYRVAFAKYTNVVIGCNWFDAELWINGEYKGHTPICLPLKEREEYLLKFRSEGYGVEEEHCLEIEPGLEEAYATLEITPAMQFHLIARNVYIKASHIIELIKKRMRC
ncbi:MAG: hypothetical protein WCR85_00150 [Sphaerochaeta sp.]